MSTIESAIPDNETKLFFILSDGWVYEGEIDEMFAVLNDMWYLGDFYIVSSKFNWFIAVSHIEENAIMYSRLFNKGRRIREYYYVERVSVQ